MAGKRATNPKANGTGFMNAWDFDLVVKLPATRKEISIWGRELVTGSAFIYSMIELN